MPRSTRTTMVLAALLFVSVFSSAALAVAPTKEAVRSWISRGVYDQKVANWKAFKAAGGCEPSEYATADSDRRRSSLALSAGTRDSMRVLVIMVDFPDYRYNSTEYGPADGPLGKVSGTPEMFDSLLFSQRGVDSVTNPTGSMTDFYLENSYGNLLIQGDVFGWYTMRENYSYYVGTNDGQSLRTQAMVKEAIDAAWADNVDFSLFTDEYNRVPGVIIIHAGPGAETDQYGIWSHKSKFAPTYYGSVEFENYTIQPEELSNNISSMGVFVHEWGHILGAPDLYDLSRDSVADGLGEWSLMASGSWNHGGKSPAHFDAYTRFLTGFADITWLSGNIANAEIPMVEFEPIIYGLPAVLGGPSLEFWLVENRQRVGFDYYLPGSGLCIYHVDATVDRQNNPDRYMVALEQADGRDDLARVYNNSGDGGDPWPGNTDNRNFHDFSSPSARLNTNDGSLGVPTEVGVWNISNSDSLMYADLDVEYSRPFVLLYGDSITMTDHNDDIFEQGDTVYFTMEVKNYMRKSYNPRVTVSVDSVEFIQNDASLGLSLNPSTGISNSTQVPVIFTIPENFASSMTLFTVTLTSDSVSSAGDGAFQEIWRFSMVLGKPQILLVDDDNGNSDETGYVKAFERMGLPYVRWDKSVQSSPTGLDLAPFEYVFWMTGNQRTAIPGGTLVAADVQAMKYHLDHGGNLALAGKQPAGQLPTLDPGFVSEYLHANISEDSLYGLKFADIAGSPIASGQRYWYDSRARVYFKHHTLEAINGGQPAMMLKDLSLNDLGVAGVTFNGQYKTVFLTFAIEYLNADIELLGFSPPDSLIKKIMYFFSRGFKTGVEDDVRRTLLPTDFALAQNYPNPFNPTTTISYSIAAGKAVMTDLSIFNVLGRKVTTLVHKMQGPGSYTVTWDAATSGRSRIASGTYFYRLVRGGRAESKKMMLLK